MLPGGGNHGGGGGGSGEDENPAPRVGHVCREAAEARRELQSIIGHGESCEAWDTKRSEQQLETSR